MPNKEDGPSPVDIREDDLLALSSAVLDTLLRDHTTGQNIFWATHDYEALGSEYDYHSPHLPYFYRWRVGNGYLAMCAKSKQSHKLIFKTYSSWQTN